MIKEIDLIKLKNILRQHSITLVGIMGVGKSTIGSYLAKYLQLPFYDSDREIEACAQLTINDLFFQYGEPEFRDLEKRVIARILEKKPLIMATGHGAFAYDETRDIIKKTSITIWLKTELDIVLPRLKRRTTRPMLLGKDHHKVVKDLLEKRFEIYNQADLKIDCGDQPKEEITYIIVKELQHYLI